MKAEERLDKLDHVITVWEGHTISKNQKTTVEACGAYDLAREAVALLRRAAEREMVHACPGPMTRPCRCGLAEFETDLRKFLDGEP